MSTQAARRGPTPEEIIAQQKEDAERAKNLPARVAGSALALPVDDAVGAYLDDIAPAGFSGRLVKFDGKAGKFVTPDDDGEIDEDAEYIALCGETQVGWIRFNGKGIPPDRHLGLLFEGYVPPGRGSLGDTDETQWQTGLSGKAEDPWKQQMSIVLQSVTTSEVFTFATMSNTGRRAVGNLLRHYRRMRKADPADLPIVRLQPGGYEGKMGWVHAPLFVVVGKTSKDYAVKADIKEDLDDDIPGF